jgi:hypothetical protein
MPASAGGTRGDQRDEDRERGWLKITNRTYWRYPLEVEGALRRAGVTGLPCRTGLGRP